MTVNRRKTSFQAAGNSNGSRPSTTKTAAKIAVNPKFSSMPEQPYLRTVPGACIAPLPAPPFLITLKNSELAGSTTITSLRFASDAL
jgi:hypothetical protein